MWNYNFNVLRIYRLLIGQFIIHKEMFFQKGLSSNQLIYIFTKMKTGNEHFEMTSLVYFTFGLGCKVLAEEWSSTFSWKNKSKIELEDHAKIFAYRPQSFQLVFELYIAVHLSRFYLHKLFCYSCYILSTEHWAHFRNGCLTPIQYLLGLWFNLYNKVKCLTWAC